MAGWIWMVVVLGCSGPSESTPETTPGADPAPAPAAEQRPPLERGLILGQARFVKVNGKTRPAPATLSLWTRTAEGWQEHLIEDPASNVIHKGIWWRDGILTIGAMGARLTHWTRSKGSWAPELVWERSWGGKIDRLRDLEIGDVTGDGIDDLVMATHDQGVVVVGVGAADGSFAFIELDAAPDTFVHEVEVGDVDRDGVPEFYATPSDRNRSSGASQPGLLVRYDYEDGAFVRSVLADWKQSHAKEVLVADTGSGDELFVVREGVVRVDPATKLKSREHPVEIVQYLEDGKGSEPRVIATLEDDQCRFLLPASLGGTAGRGLIAAGKESGLWWLRKNREGVYERIQIDADSSGFEHAVHATDLDGDGHDEVYVASDDQHELRAYTWNGAGFDKEVLGTIPPRTFTWNIQDGPL